MWGLPEHTADLITWSFQGCGGKSRTENSWFLTWGGRLDLGLQRQRFLGVCGGPQGLRWRLLPSLHLTLVGEQVLDVLLLQRAGRAAGCPDVQLRRQLPPLLILIHLRKRRRRRRTDLFTKFILGRTKRSTNTDTSPDVT